MAVEEGYRAKILEKANVAERIRVITNGVVLEFFAPGEPDPKFLHIWDLEVRLLLRGHGRHGPLCRGDRFRCGRPPASIGWPRPGSAAGSRRHPRLVVRPSRLPSHVPRSPRQAGRLHHNGTRAVFSKAAFSFSTKSADWAIRSTGAWPARPTCRGSGGFTCTITGSSSTWPPRDAATLSFSTASWPWRSIGSTTTLSTIGMQWTRVACPEALRRAWFNSLAIHHLQRLVHDVATAGA